MDGSASFNEMGKNATCRMTKNNTSAGKEGRLDTFGIDLVYYGG